MRSSRPRLLASAILLCAVALAACKRKHISLEAYSDRPYPACPGAEAGAEELIARGRLRAAESLQEQNTLEKFEIVRRDCQVVVRVRQEWIRAGTDIEAVYDAQLRPLRAWRRVTIPMSTRADGHADIRSYDLRGEQVVLKRRSTEGKISYETIQGPLPSALIGAGRGLLTIWIRRANLAVGQKVREPVLDFRETFELIRDVTLKREADRFEPSLERTVRVYTIYGREAVFTDNDNVVVGDLAGLRPSQSLASPEPEPLPTFEPIDPRRTP